MTSGKGFDVQEGGKNAYRVGIRYLNGGRKVNAEVAV